MMSEESLNQLKVFHNAAQRAKTAALARATAPARPQSAPTKRTRLRCGGDAVSFIAWAVQRPIYDLRLVCIAQIW